MKGSVLRFQSKFVSHNILPKLLPQYVQLHTNKNALPLLNRYDTLIITKLVLIFPNFWNLLTITIHDSVDLNLRFSRTVKLPTSNNVLNLSSSNVDQLRNRSVQPSTSNSATQCTRNNVTPLLSKNVQVQRRGYWQFNCK